MGDYMALRDSSDSSRTNGHLRLLTGLAGAFATGLAVSQLRSSSEQSDDKLTGRQPFQPAAGVEKVTVRPGGPVPSGLSIFSKWRAPACLFTEKQPPFTQGCGEVKDGWLYGATQSTTLLPAATGLPGDVLKGHLYCWPKKQFQEIMPAAEHYWVRRTVVSVVLSDGSTSNAYWFHQAGRAEEAQDPRLENLKNNLLEQLDSMPKKRYRRHSFRTRTGGSHGEKTGG
eukprot:gb/GEZN01015402.1/.p1 GENE.gb/GEZN01015402.1/~~gb/GEZN01015402.1/.p1  ORF type:complete len:227 (+),score=35.54 gb/GEZN01015402.1/:52-732(+)